MKTLEEQRKQLKQGIAALKAAGRPYDYLQERLLALTPPKPNPVDVFAFKEIKPLFINDKELAELQSFGFCLNEYAYNDKLKSHPVWTRHHES